ncbi:hypothetical protein [Inovirus D_HF2_144]|nr:hypothetical protein [Inovirus D_HF2_144]DAR73295.1 MAG TPA: hypothetical protein [Inoviridae sp.]
MVNFNRPLKMNRSCKYLKGLLNLLRRLCETRL